MSTNNLTGNNPPASDAAMQLRLKYYEKARHRAEKRVSGKKEAIAEQERELASIEQQFSDEKHATPRDQERIEELGKQAEAKREEIQAESERHNALVLDFQKLIDMKSDKSTEELLSEIGELMKKAETEGVEFGDAESDDEDGDGKAA
jgi:chromosome segregation ATPase